MNLIAPFDKSVPHYHTYPARHFIPIEEYCENNMRGKEALK